ncbi:MAG: RIP metalloprotease RseP [Hyphomicrobiaceae bacterium]
MDVLSLLSNFLWIPAFLFVLTIVIFFHELGHFLVARWCGVTVVAFSIGFGREIVHWIDRHGTRWRIAWLPFGGYVKFVDDDNVASVPTTGQGGETAGAVDGRFHTKKLWQRAAVVAAGPIANFILAILVFGGIYWMYGERYTLARVDSVVEGGAAEKAGFKPGDLIVGVDGSPIETFTDLQLIVMASADRQLTFTVERDGQSIELKATPERKERTDHFGNTYRTGMIGITQSPKIEDVKLRSYSLPGALWRGVTQTQFIVTETFRVIGDIIIGRESARQLGGPIKIAEVSGQAASLGWVSLFSLIAGLSVSIGLLNLFPIPILDGGYLMFCVYEAIVGKPVPEKAQAIGFRIGIAILGVLMVFVTTNDLVGKISQWLGQ